MIGEKLRKFLFTEGNRVSKTASEFVYLVCRKMCEEGMMRMISKNERLYGRLDEYEKRLERNVCASMVAKSVTGVKNAASVVKKPAKAYAVVVKPKDDDVKMTSEEVKAKVMKNVSATLDVCVRAVRKTRSGGLAIKKRGLKKLSKCKKFAEIDPKVVVFDVENVMMNHEFLSELYLKNLEVL